VHQHTSLLHEGERNLSSPLQLKSLTLTSIASLLDKIMTSLLEKLHDMQKRLNKDKSPLLRQV